MIIRFFEPADTDSVAGLLQEMSRHYNGAKASSYEVVRKNLVENILGPDSGVRIVVAVKDKHVMAVAMISLLYPAPKEHGQLFMKEIYVAADARSSGIGRQLMSWIANYAVSKNCSRFDWTVDAGNVKAVDFYKKLGAIHVADKLYFRFNDKILEAYAKK
jgi:ribosomal protein S18 acetylase RimI-like enzyme